VEEIRYPPLSSAALLLMKFFSENHSGDVNNHSGRLGFFIHLTPESIFTSRRNRYSHHSGTIIHMPRNPHNIIDTVRRAATSGYPKEDRRLGVPC
jgi:hypothetical protein